MVGDAGTTGVGIVEDATCLGCACLCDDIGVVVDDGRIVETRRACPIGVAWYGIGREVPEDTPRVVGRPSGWDEALDRGATILRSARAPLVWGLAGATIESQRIALAIADRIGACVGLAGHDRGRLRPFQRLGQISATLGEVKDRADLIVYDVLFPIAQLPRLRERYADDSVGPFVPRGRAGRTIIRLSRYPEGTPACPADLDIIVRPRQPACFYQTLRAAVNGVDLDPTEVERTTQHPLATFLDLANRLKRARYGAFFVANRGGSEVDMEAILALVRDLNAFTRFVVIHPTFDGANRSGAEAVLAWQAGAGGHVDFSLGHPRYLPEEEAIGRLASREVDAALLLIDGPADLDWTIARHDAAGHLGQIPRVVIRPADAVGASWTPRGVAHSINALMYAAEVDLPSARPGIDEGGTVVRFDGVMLPLRPPIAERRRTQRGILLDLDTRLAAKPSCQDVTA